MKRCKETAAGSFLFLANTYLESRLRHCLADEVVQVAVLRSIGACVVGLAGEVDSSREIKWSMSYPFERVVGARWWPEV